MSFVPNFIITHTCSIMLQPQNQKKKLFLVFFSSIPNKAVMLSTMVNGVSLTSFHVRHLQVNTSTTSLEM